MARSEQTHFVEFFDSMTMRNRIEKCRVIRMTFSGDKNVESMATVEITVPTKKTIRVPLNCLTCAHTGYRLG